MVDKLFFKGGGPSLRGPAHRRGLVTSRWILPQQAADNQSQGGGRWHVHLSGSQYYGLQLQERLPDRPTRSEKERGEISFRRETYMIMREILDQLV